MSNSYTKEIETPVAGHKVVIKTLISGAEREQIESAEYKLIKQAETKEFTVTDTSKLMLAKKHELLRVSVVTIDGDATDCLERCLKMYEPDYDCVYQQILEEQKKMMPSTSPQS